MQRSALCRSRRELSNAYFLAKFGLDAAENFGPAASVDGVSPSRSEALRSAPKCTRSTMAGAQPRPARKCSGVRPFGSRMFGSAPCWSASRTLAYHIELQGSCQFFANFEQKFARFRLYRHRSLQVNTRSSAFLRSTRLSNRNFNCWQNFAD